MFKINTKKSFICFLMASAMMTPASLYAQTTPVIHVVDDNPSQGAATATDGLSSDGSIVLGRNNQDSIIWTVAGGIRNITTPGLFAGATAPTGISADNSTVVGYGYDASMIFQAYRWTDATGMELLDSTNMWQNGSVAFGTSSNGSVITGYGYDASTVAHAFRWTAASGMQELDNLNLFTSGSQAAAISSDGTVIAGSGYNALGNQHAFRWTETNGIEDIHGAGLETSTTAGMSSNGSVIAGYGYTATFDQHAFRWTAANGMQDIHDPQLGWTSTLATMVSADGSTIVGAGVGAGIYKAFRWTEADGMENIHNNAWSISYATSVSANGSTIAGLYDTGVFRWTAASGSQDIYQLLVNAGIDMSSWSKLNMTNVYLSADGTRLAGTGVYSGNTHGWLFMLDSNNNGGIITPEELQQAMAGGLAPQQQAQAAMSSSFDQSLMVARNALGGYLRSYSYGSDTSSSAASSNLEDIAPAAGGTMRRKALYATGAVGIGQNDNFSSGTLNGATGALFALSDEVAAGFGVVGSYNREETYLNGKSRTRAGGLQVMAAHESLDNGLRLYGTATVAKLEVTNERHYLNGSGVDSSTGKTDGMGYGAALKAGYEFDVPGKTSMKMMPYAELDLSHVSMDGYTEMGGGFPAIVGSQSANFVASRIGAEVSAPVTAKTLVRGRAAWGHRYTNGGAAVSTIAGLTQSVPYDNGERDWAELGVGMNWRMTDSTTLTGDLSGRVGRTSEPAANLIVGVVWNWN